MTFFQEPIKMSFKIWHSMYELYKQKIHFLRKLELLRNNLVFNNCYNFSAEIDLILLCYLFNVTDLKCINSYIFQLMVSFFKFSSIGLDL